MPRISDEVIPTRCEYRLTDITFQTSVINNENYLVVMTPTMKTIPVGTYRTISDCAEEVLEAPFGRNPSPLSTNAASVIEGTATHAEAVVYARHNQCLMVEYVYSRRQKIMVHLSVTHYSDANVGDTAQKYVASFASTTIFDRFQDMFFVLSRRNRKVYANSVTAIKRNGMKHTGWHQVRVDGLLMYKQETTNHTLYWRVEDLQVGTVNILEAIVSNE